MVVSEFKHKFRPLSNFAPIYVLGPGANCYPSVEHAYQAAKTRDKRAWRALKADSSASGANRRSFALSDQQLKELLDDPSRWPEQMSAGEAKRFGSIVVQIRDDWTPEKRIAAMENLVFQKFSSGQSYRSLLLSCDGLIEEGNSWNDRFWGISPVGSGVGENHLGKILMRVRDRLRSGEENDPESDQVFWEAF